MVQEEEAQHKEGCHAGQRTGIVWVGTKQEALVLIVLEGADWDLQIVQHTNRPRSEMFENTCTLTFDV